MMTYLFVFKVIARHCTCCGSVKYTKDLRRSWCGKPNCCNQLVLSLLFSLIYMRWIATKSYDCVTRKYAGKKTYDHLGLLLRFKPALLLGPQLCDTYTSHNLKLQPPLSYTEYSLPRTPLTIHRISVDFAVFRTGSILFEWMDDTGNRLS